MFCTVKLACLSTLYVFGWMKQNSKAFKSAILLAFFFLAALIHTGFPSFLLLKAYRHDNRLLILVSFCAKQAAHGVASNYMWGWSWHCPLTTILCLQDFNQQLAVLFLTNPRLLCFQDFSSVWGDELLQQLHILTTDNNKTKFNPHSANRQQHKIQPNQICCRIAHHVWPVTKNCLQKCTIK